MFTVFKVREGLESYADPGWFQHPEGTVAWKTDAPPEGVDLRATPTAKWWGP